MKPSKFTAGRQAAIATLLLVVIGSISAPLFFALPPAKRSPTAARKLASATDGGRKVEILQTKMRLAHELRVRSVKTIGGNDGSLGVPLNTRLVAVVDNECAANRLHLRKAGRLGASALTLSEVALARAEKGPVEGLKIQAYAFNSLEDSRLDDLEADAQDDECVLNLVDERERHVLANPTNDPLEVSQQHLAFLNAPAAWTMFYGTGRPITADVVVAVVDTGVELTHEDIAPNLWQGPNGSAGYDFISNSTNVSDDIGHGTHVAGLLGAAMNNSRGGAGVMGPHIKIMAVRVIDSNDTGTLSQLINGIHFAADNGASVINLSLGGPDGAQAEIDAVNYAVAKGAVVVIAAGNSGLQMNATQNNYPAGYAYEIPGAVAVGSVDSKTGNQSFFSNYSSDYVYIAAPGADDSTSNIGLLSTYPGNQYQRLEGTSMSAPLVSAAAAYVFAVAKTSGLKPAPKDVVNTILNSARSVPALTSSFRNGAVLDLSRLSQIVQLGWMLDGDAGTGESP